jgi:hypothetical protein
MQLVQKVEVTRGQHMAIYKCQTASQVSLYVVFLTSWINLPTKTTKIGTPCIKVISQYFSYIMAASYIGGGNQNTPRKPPTCGKSLTNLIT